MNLDELIQAEREAPPTPSADEQRTVWTSLERSIIGAPVLPLGAGKLSLATKLGTALSTTAGKVVLATAVVAGGTAATKLRVPTPPTHARHHETERSTNARNPQQPQRPKTASVVPAPPGQSKPATVDVPIQRPKMRKVQPTPLAAEATPPPQSTDGSQQPDAPAEETLNHGLLLITRAEQALEQGRPNVALVLLRRHRKLYPQSPLIERREALFVQSLCEDGRSLAPKARWKFNRSWPNSHYREHLHSVCGQSQSNPAAPVKERETVDPWKTPPDAPVSRTPALRPPTR